MHSLTQLSKVVYIFVLLNYIDMPKLYEYFGLVFLFYSKEHEPIHVHGK